MEKKVKKLKKVLRKDENFGIVMHQWPLSIGQVFLLKF